MTDEETREIERATLADPGDVQAKAALLTARIRAGTLLREHVIFAAYCGDEASRLALLPQKGMLLVGLGVLYLDTKDPALETCQESLRLFKVPVMRRATLAAARCALATIDKTRAKGRRYGAAPETVTVWPRGTATKAGAFSLPFSEAMRNVFARMETWLETETEGDRHAWAMAACFSDPPMWIPMPHDSVNACAVRIERAVAVAGPRRVRHAIRDALVAWALE